MDSKSALMLGAAAAALAAGPGLAAPQSARSSAVPVVASYAELLEPIPDAVERLQLAEAEAAARPPQLIEVQFDHHHHHHHHHDHHDRAWYQQNGYIWANGGWILRPPPRPYHHHHHNGWWYRHNGYHWNGNAWVRPHHHHHDHY
jgi:hypothetical protein